MMQNSRSKFLSDSLLLSIDTSSRILLVNESPRPRHATESKNIREVTDSRSSLKSADQYFFAFANICPTIRRHNSCSRLLPLSSASKPNSDHFSKNQSLLRSITTMSNFGVIGSPTPRLRRPLIENHSLGTVSSGSTSGRPQLPHCFEKTLAGAPIPKKKNSPHRGHLNDASRETFSTLKI